MHAPRTALRGGCSLRFVSDDSDFDQYVAGQASGLNRGPSRRVGREVLAVNPVHRAEIVQVRHEYVGHHNIVESQGLGFDIDQLGTFTREIPRAGTQLEAAKRKARIGMEWSGSLFGLASEGAFGPDPGIGLIPWNVEYVTLIDDARRLELVGRAEGPARQIHRTVTDWAAMLTFAEEAGFPHHHLVLRPDNDNDPRVVKGIGDLDSLERTFAWALEQSATNPAVCDWCNP